MKTENKIKNIYFSGRGFTLLELMISMAILGIMIMVSIASLMPARNQAKLTAVQADIATTIKTMQSYALQGKVTDGVVPAGYGFKFINDHEYQLFYCNPYSNCSNSTSDFPLGSPIAIQDRGVTLTSPSYSDTRIYFNIPSGNLEPDRTSLGDLIFTLQLGIAIKTITIKKSGAITES